MNKGKGSKQLFIFLFRFIGGFCLLFYGTEAVIALSSPENSYSPFVARYLNYIEPYCNFLLQATKGLVALLGFQAESKAGHILAVPGGTGIRLAFDCIGYGVLSFWIAFVLANPVSAGKKLAWLIGGAALLCAANIARLSLVLVANNRGWASPFGWDHHTWFNIASYLFIFGMIWRFDRSGKKQRSASRAANTAQRQNEEGQAAVSIPATADKPKQTFIATHQTNNDHSRN